MESFSTTFLEGFWHVINWPNFELLLFVISIAVVATFKDWKKLILISLIFLLGFLLGTLATHYELFTLKESISAFVQAVMLMILAIFNFTVAGKNSNNNFRVFVGGLFGVISGSQFQESLVSQLFKNNFLSELPAFVLGIEAGILAGIFFMLILSWLVANAFGLAKRDWILILSGAVLGIATTIFFDSLF